MKSGFVTIVGRPNVGKSTLLNTILQTHISIATPLPQTTQHQIKGIYTTEQGQIVFVDTPGIHETTKKFGTILNDSALQTLRDKDIDLILYMIDISRPYGPEEEFISHQVFSQKKPVIIVLNKIDAPRSHLGEYKELLNGHQSVSISALLNEHVDSLVQSIYEKLPEAPPFYDPDDITDKNMRFITAELIRKHIISNLFDEIPHATAVQIESYKENEDGSSTIRAVIYSETESQKKILIGSNGSMIKNIRVGAKKDLKTFVDGPVSLSLHVKVKKKWRNDEHFLKSLDIIIT